MAKEQSLKAKRVLTIILNKLYKYCKLSGHIYFNMFDTKETPLLLYGAKIWGTRRQKNQLKLCTIMPAKDMCVKQRASNMAVLGDCGRHPLYIAAAKKNV
jgi:hypothetical protein